MEFRYRAGDQIPPTLGFFVPPPQRGMMVPVPELRAPLLRELQKERIREEIIEREIAEHKILEEEVRREMAIERTMGIRRIPVADSLMLTPRSQDFIAQRLHPQFVTMEERLSFRVDPSDVFEEELGLDHRVLDREAAEVRVEEASPKVSGVKRKDNASANEMWGCALCHVSATCEGQLNIHLQGKKHKSNTRLLGLLKKNTKSKEGEYEDEVEEMEELMVNGTMHRVVRRNKFYFCKPCHIECNSQRMMATHITSKKHVAWMGKCSSGGGGGKRAKESIFLQQASPKVSGVKRKDNASANEMWGCALCHVSATCEGQLNIHLQGKKHKSNTRLLGLLKKNTKSKEGEDEDEVEAMEELMVNGTMHRVARRNKFYFCKPCHIECNSQRMMAVHITSKKHVAWMGKCRSSSGGGGKRAKESMFIPEDALKDEKFDAGDNSKLEARNDDSDLCVDSIH